MKDRESDIRELCQGVLSLLPIQKYYGNGPDTSSCPFCYEYLPYISDDIDNIKHLPTCSYLIAKDLSTGIKTDK